MNRRGMSIPIIIAVAIVLFFSGRYAWLKYRLIQWNERTTKDLAKTRRTLIETIKGSSYPVFQKAGITIPAPTGKRGITIHAKRIEEGDNFIGAASAGEKQRNIATFYNCQALDGGSCKVKAYRLYIDGGKALGDEHQFVGTLYLEKREAEIQMSELAKLDEKLDESTDVDHQRLVRTVTRVRFKLDRKDINATTAPLHFEVLCIQPELREARQEIKATAEVQVKVSFKKPQRK